MQHRDEHTGNNRQGLRNIILWVFLGIVLFFLLTEHQAHVFGVLPYVLLLACPLMHLFMHRGHGGHGHQSDDASRGENDHEHGGSCCGGRGKQGRNDKEDQP